MERNSFSYNNLFPKIKSVNQKREFQNINTDDINFAKNQYKKIYKELFIKKFRKLKPWERPYDNNLCFSSDKDNRFILKNNNYKLNAKKINKIKKRPKIIDWSSIGNFSNKEINNIYNSLSLSKNIKDNYEIKKKMNLSKENTLHYIDNIKIMCVDNFITRLIESERKKIKTKNSEYENNLQKELLNLSEDIHRFDDFKIQNKNQFKKDEEFLNELMKDKKNLNFEIKKLSHEYFETSEQIKKEIEIILDLKTYANFIHKLLGNGQYLIYNDINNKINYNRYTDNELNILIINIFSIFYNLLS